MNHFQVWQASTDIPVDAFPPLKSLIRMCWHLSSASASELLVDCIDCWTFFMIISLSSRVPRTLFFRETPKYCFSSLTVLGTSRAVSEK